MPDSIAVTTERVGLSSRRFIELFRRQVGLTPKVFCRVRRFQQVLERVHREEVHRGDMEWAQVALACGYYDPIALHSRFPLVFRSHALRVPGRCNPAFKPCPACLKRW